jgi:hypothetical protein
LLQTWRERRRGRVPISYSLRLTAPHGILGRRLFPLVFSQIRSFPLSRAFTFLRIGYTFIEFFLGDKRLLTGESSGYPCFILIFPSDWGDSILKYHTKMQRKRPPA